MLPTSRPRESLTTAQVPTRQYSPLASQWIRVTSRGYTAAQWRMPGEDHQEQWLYLAMVS